MSQILPLSKMGYCSKFCQVPFFSAECIFSKFLKLSTNNVSERKTDVHRETNC